MPNVKWTCIIFTGGWNLRENIRKKHCVSLGEHSSLRVSGMAAGPQLEDLVGGSFQPQSRKLLS